MRLCRLVLPLPFIATLFAGGGAAQATSFQYGTYTVVNEQVISISSPTMAAGGVGEIILEGSGANAGQTLLAWCLDIYTALKSAGTYNIGTLTAAGSGAPNPTLTNAQIGEIGALMLNGERLANSMLNSSAATQLAIWEVEYGSKFHFAGLNSGTVSLAQQYLNDANGVWGPVQPTLLTGSNDQSLGVVPTPLPPTWSMLLAVLVGLGLWTGKERLRSSGA
jgi:hypothetical protein